MAGQAAGVFMIKFESAYAVPDKRWRQYASIPLEKQQLPDEIVFTSAHYGQIGVRRVSVMWKRKRHRYAVYKKEGANIATVDQALLIGPVAATPADPTHRLDCDKACYREIKDACVK